MGNPLPSASRIGLAMTCAGSAIYPRTDRLSEYADTGHGVHGFMRDLASMSRDEALERVAPEYRARCEALDVSSLPLDGLWRAEAAYGYDVETEKARLIGYDVGRNYGPRETPTEVFMSVDAIIESEEPGTLIIVDWKTGVGRLPPALENWQLRLQSLAVQRHTGCERVRAFLVRLPADGTPWVEPPAEFDAFDLDIFAAELRELARRLAKPESVVPVVGSHCKYCPALEACPAQGKLLARMAASPEQLAGDILDNLTPETAFRAYERLKAVDTVLKRVREALHAYAFSTPIPLGDGYVYGPVNTSLDEFDATVVRQVLTEMHGAEVAEKACDFKTSKAAIERALRPVYERRKQGQKTTLKALREEVLEAVREAGGIQVKPRTEVKEHREESQS